MEAKCQACLASGVAAGFQLYPLAAADAELLEFYRLVTNKPEDMSDSIRVCAYCRSVLRRMTRFVERCRLAQQLLRTPDDLSATDRLQTFVPHPLSRSATECHYIGPETSIGDDRASDDDDDNVPLVMLKQNTGYDSTGCDSHLDTDNITINMETDTKTGERRRAKKLKKKKKEARDGFTSRMVTETDEYKVIRLTKEEIIEEMRRYSQSEKYRLLPYKCEECVKGFNFPDVLEKHMEKHSPKNGSLQCEVCTQRCPSRVSLRGHMKSHCTRYKCKLCGLVRLSRQHILEHYRLQHSGAPAVYTCPTCDHTTNKRTAMQRHVRIHSSAPLKCEHCGKYYKSKESLRIHLLRHDAKKLYRCEVCSSSFVYAAQLSKHMECVHLRRDYYCVECDVMFKSLDNLKQHLHRAKRHRDESSYKFECQQCAARFISAATLATHATSAHGARRSQACATCARAYSSADALRWHVRRAHAAPRADRLACPLCDKTFSRAYVLRVHMRTHTGERPHARGCGDAFAQPAALREQHQNPAKEENET